MVDDCVLLSGGFAGFVQIVLGLIALSGLVYKRHREHPKRPVKVWALDVSKQCFGGLLAHGLNIVIADHLASHTNSDHDQVP